MYPLSENHASSAFSKNHLFPISYTGCRQKLPGVPGAEWVSARNRMPPFGKLLRTRFKHLFDSVLDDLPHSVLGQFVRKKDFFRALPRVEVPFTVGFDGVRTEPGARLPAHGPG